MKRTGFLFAILCAVLIAVQAQEQTPSLAAASKLNERFSHLAGTLQTRPLAWLWSTTTTKIILA